MLNTPTPGPAGWGDSILDRLPDPSISELARVAQLCEAQERQARADSARSQRAAQDEALDRVDAAESRAFASGRPVATHEGILAAYDAVTTAEDARRAAQERREGTASGRAQVLHELARSREQTRQARERVRSEYIQAFRARESVRRLRRSTYPSRSTTGQPTVTGHGEDANGLRFDFLSDGTVSYR